MATAALVIALISSSITVTQQTVGLVAALRAVHNHTTKVVYKRVLRPIGKAVAHDVK